MVPQVRKIIFEWMIDLHSEKIIVSNLQKYLNQ